MHADGLWWDTDDFYIYLCPIRVYPRSSVVCFWWGRLRLIIDCMWKNGVLHRWTGQKQTEGKPGTRNTLCAGDRRESNTKYAQPWISVARLPLVCFCRATTALRHFFTGTVYIAEPCFWHRWTQIGPDGTRMDFVFIRAPSVLIRVHLWFVFDGEGSAW